MKKLGLLIMVMVLLLGTFSTGCTRMKPLIGFNIIIESKIVITSLHMAYVDEQTGELVIIDKTLGETHQYNLSQSSESIASIYYEIVGDDHTIYLYYSVNDRSTLYQMDYEGHVLQSKTDNTTNSLRLLNGTLYLGAFEGSSNWHYFENNDLTKEPIFINDIFGGGKFADINGTRFYRVDDMISTTPISFVYWRLNELNKLNEDIYNEIVANYPPEMKTDSPKIAEQKSYLYNGHEIIMIFRHTSDWIYLINTCDWKDYIETDIYITDIDTRQTEKLGELGARQAIVYVNTEVVHYFTENKMYEMDFATKTHRKIADFIVDDGKNKEESPFYASFTENGYIIRRNQKPYFIYDAIDKVAIVQ
jgi:hypothetical protein